MNSYSIAGSGEYVPTPPQESAPQMSMAAVVALTDQLEAVVRDVASAWGSFAYGPMPTGGTTEQMTRPVDRLESVGKSIHEQIMVLAQLADDIRRRGG